MTARTQIRNDLDELWLCSLYCNRGLRPGEVAGRHLTWTVPFWGMNGDELYSGFP